MAKNMALLKVSDLHVHIPVDGAMARAVDGVSFAVEKGQVFGMVGESGCGKSISARAVLGLLPKSANVSGRVEFGGAGDLTRLGPEEMRRIRGKRIAAVFQDPMTYLNPVYTVGNQMSEVYRLHQGMTKRQARAAARDMLGRVRIADPDACAESYPWQLSGGMRQRVLIAMALACKPDLLIADEPTTALDPTTQARVLDLLTDLVEEFGTSLWLITHDLAVAKQLCDKAAVMYAGKIVEIGLMDIIAGNPAHPYTRGLIEAVEALENGEINETIPGQAHPSTAHPPGCRFHPRCKIAGAECAVKEPALAARGAGHLAACDRI